MGKANSEYGEPVGARMAWWLLAISCTVYAAYAVQQGFDALASQWSGVPILKPRAAPWVFVAHAFTGAVALFAGPLQFHSRVRARQVVHRIVGRTYVVAVLVAAAFAVLDVLTFGVTPASKIVFAIIATAWFSVTAVGFITARQRRFAEHREWMIRSFATSMFFISFSFWVPGLAHSALPTAIAYPFALALSGGGNLAIAELWIRWSRTRSAPVSALSSTLRPQRAR